VAEPTATRPSARGLGLVIFLGFSHALWSLFQWTQLVAARSGGTSFCGLDGDSTRCTEIWDSPFAAAIQEWTGVPVAGWGLVWSLAAFALPLWALVGKATPQTRDDNAPSGSAWAATILLALGGIAAIVVLFSVSILQGALCTTCVVTYTLVAAYAASCFVQTPPLSIPLMRGVSVVSVTLAASFALLFIPGLQTPMSDSAEASKAIQRATARSTNNEHAETGQSGERGESGGARESEGAAESEGAGESSEPGQAGEMDASAAAVAQLLQELPPQSLQAFSDELLRFSQTPKVPMPAPRTLIGPPDAAVRVTEFTDVLCGHCASLHGIISQLRASLPPAAFSLEPRHFPLDPACNPTLEGESKAPIRCLAALAEICLEGRHEAFEFAGRLYENQRHLDEDLLYALAAPFVDRETLSTCVADPATNAKLQQDITWAKAHEIEGTPLVLINGEAVAPFGPLIYALVVLGGDADHPVFDGLPQGRIRDPHEGHGH
jgi:protein-disulfide isomerase